jgi:hypothetical protein
VVDPVGLVLADRLERLDLHPELVAPHAHQRFPLRLALRQRRGREPPQAGQAVIVVGATHQQHSPGSLDDE